MPRPGHLAPAAVHYTSGQQDRGLLARFAARLAARGYRVGGIVQEAVFDDAGDRIGLDAIEVDTGRRIPLARKGMTNACSFDTAALTDTTAALRRALAERVDAIVVEKFGEREAEGNGLADDMLSAMAAGLPVACAVPADRLARWHDVIGDLGCLVPWDERALWGWWGRGHLHRELVALAPADVTAKRVVVGQNWTLVDSDLGCGLAHTPPKDGPGCRPIDGAGGLAGQSLRALAERLLSDNPQEAAIGLAAINAATNRADLPTSAENGLDLLAECQGPVTVIGRFPGLADRFGDVRVVERDPHEGEFPADQAQALLAEGDGALITASALIGADFPDLLGAARGRVVLIGPGTPLAPLLFDYGVDLLAGFVVTDAEGAARAVAEGGGMGALRPFGRNAVLKSEVRR